MTLTEDAPAAAPASSSPPGAAPASAGLASFLGTGDHKVVGRIWLVASLVQLVLAGAAALWVAVLRIDTADLATDAPDFFAQAFTFRSIGGAFLFLLPLTIGIATLVVPLQVGAPTIAFPRAAAAAVWTYLFGSLLIVGAYAIDGGPFGSDTDGVRLFIVAFLLVLVALVVAWICIATTVIALRTPGMALTRVPLFAWSTLVAATVWTLVLPVLAGVVLIAYIDIRYGGSGKVAGRFLSVPYRQSVLSVNCRGVRLWCGSVCICGIDSEHPSSTVEGSITSRAVFVPCSQTSTPPLTHVRVVALSGRMSRPLKSFI
jgi:cytochrome c oxidase subunit 1